MTDYDTSVRGSPVMRRDPPCGRSEPCPGCGAPTFTIYEHAGLDANQWPVDERTTRYDAGGAFKPAHPHRCEGP